MGFETTVFSFLLYINWIAMMITGYSRFAFILGMAACWAVSYLISFVRKRRNGKTRDTE